MPRAVDPPPPTRNPGDGPPASRDADGWLVLGPSSSGPPRLWVVPAEGGGRPQPLPLQGDFWWRVGGERVCTGRVQEGLHQPCPTAQPLQIGSQCLPCSGLEDAACIFEPQCARDATSCHCTFGTVPHVVYAAFYGTLPKVGMTQAWRVATRLREQGADAYFTIHQAPSRSAAREAERTIATLYHLPEWRTHRETLPQLARPVPWDLIEERAGGLRLRLEGRFDVERRLHRIEDHVLAQPLARSPVRVQPHGEHLGRWLGQKGPYLVYQEGSRPDRLAAGALAAVKGPDLSGRTLKVMDARLPS